MEDFEEITQKLNSQQKIILKELLKSGTTLLFNVKGMVQITYSDDPFKFVEMGFEDIDKLLKWGLVEHIHPESDEYVIEGREFRLSQKGKNLALTLISHKL